MPTRDEPPLIPREHFFGNPHRSGIVLSPDGTRVAWLAPIGGVNNLWIAPRTELGAARPLTRFHDRAPGGAVFAHDGAHLLFGRDNDGDENGHIFALHIESGEIRDLTPFEGASCSVLATSRHVPGQLLALVNDRDPRFHDVYSIEIASGERRRVEHNDAGHAAFLCDKLLNLRLAWLVREDGSCMIQQRGAGGGWQDWIEIPVEDSMSTQWSHLDAAGETLYLFDSRGRDTAALVAIDLATGRTNVLGEDARADVDAMLTDPADYRPVAWSSDYLRRRFHALGESHAADIAFLDAADIGDWSLGSRTRDDRLWIVGSDSDTRPGAAWLYDREARSLELLFHSRPELAGRVLARVHPIEIVSRDGLTMTAYLTLPPDLDATPPSGADPVRPAARTRLPLVLSVHGGPAMRDSFGYDAESQWLADRGYAVLKVNYRGSRGFGKAMLAAGEGEWGLRMSDDLDDAADWAVQAGIADPDRIAITGASYGGFAVLVALTRTPERYACGVDLVGPSNLETLLASIPPYWESVRQNLYRQIGDPRTEAGRERLAARSPIHAADRIVRPLLIGQGGNDPRVPQAEADQMVGAMRSNGIPVTYALFPDEGHGFGRPANAMCFSGLLETFLAEHLGGRFEPLTQADRGASSVRLTSAEQLTRLFAEALDS